MVTKPVRLMMYLLHHYDGISVFQETCHELVLPVSIEKGSALIGHSSNVGARHFYQRSCVMVRRTASELGIFDSTGYPSVSDIQTLKRASASESSYVSPLTEIHEAIRRQNPIAAAAAATLGPITTSTTQRISDSSDPWDDSLYKRSPSPTLDDTDLSTPDDQQQLQPAGTICTCRWMRRSSRTLGEQPKSITNICSHCGKRQQPPQDDKRQRAPSLGAYHNYYTSKKELLQEPNHAQALLQTTPQLRIISPASTDMQVAGHTTKRNVLQRMLEPTTNKTNPTTTTPTSRSTGLLEYQQSLLKDRANQQAAAKLASLLWVLAHEMTLEDYGAVESTVFTAVFALVHSPNRMAGLAALNALLAAPSADEEKKAIKFANTLSTGLRAAAGDFEYLRAVSQALGHMATRAANVDLVESEVTRALEWLRTERSDRRCVSVCVSIRVVAFGACELALTPCACC